ncbi:MAG: FAD-dependent oxidoreductase [Bacteroidota bacterium]
MTRNEFIKMCGVLGIGMPLLSSISSCDEGAPVDPSQKVIIIGAGAAGLSAAYLLNQQGIDFQILEASARYGGRIKHSTDFASFPIPLGGEWIHVERGILDEIINDPAIPANVQTTPYDPNVDFGLYNGSQISVEQVGFTIDQKFIGSSWLDFYEQYVVPSVLDKIAFNKVVQSIDYSGDQVQIRTGSETFTADRVIVTIPVKILQSGSVTFTPALPTSKMNAINDVTVWDGFKAFISFSEKFYPTFVAFDVIPETAGQKLYYDAAYGQNTTENVLGLFTVGTGTLPYRELSDSDLIDYMLAELDGIFNGQASANYIKHISQNWNEEPFAQGAYIVDHENWQRVRRLGQSVVNKIYFAGCAYTQGEDWSSVHTAARSAKRAVEELVG